METDAEKNPSISAPKRSGEGLPYAPENWPEPGDIWGWRTGTRVSATGHYYNRYLCLPERLSRIEHRDSSREGGLCYSSKLQVQRYLESSFPDTEVDAFFNLFTWKIPATPPSPTKGSSDDGDAAMDDILNPLDLAELLTLEPEIDQVFQALGKSEEFEYTKAEERVQEQMNDLKTLYQELNSDESELACQMIILFRRIGSFCKKKIEEQMRQ